jgi:hypothetical protein
LTSPELTYFKNSSATESLTLNTETKQKDKEPSLPPITQTSEISIPTQSNLPTETFSLLNTDIISKSKTTLMYISEPSPTNFKHTENVPIVELSEPRPSF